MRKRTRTDTGPIEGAHHGTRRDCCQPERALRRERPRLEHRRHRRLDRARSAASRSNAELVAFAKKMKARQYARMLEYEDEDTGMRIKRLWSFHDQSRAAVLRRHPRDAGGRAQAIDPPVCPLPEADCAASARPWPITSPASGSSTFTPTSRKRKKPSRAKAARAAAHAK